MSSDTQTNPNPVIPSHWKIKRSTHFFTKDKVPNALLTHHNTAEGVYGQICVMQGTVTFYGFADEAALSQKKQSLSTPDSLRSVHRNIGTTS